ncbi:hypothetical protein I3842_05G170700 [Carya illinoinensis]|uniref:Uncharacterized protein n=1 Tax=Carya illinoinensis TaxID=32201 RepID=A0A922EFD7_CARIL|nr:hypothetical protein I3842_08G129100 [Carya illinoinensis]KAG6713767.1 hypothetical protein I3842_05G170700 [Carya illinoinensis]
MKLSRDLIWLAREQSACLGPPSFFVLNRISCFIPVSSRTSFFSFPPTCFSTGSLQFSSPLSSTCAEKVSSCTTVPRWFFTSRDRFISLLSSTTFSMPGF